MATPPDATYWHEIIAAGSALIGAIIGLAVQLMSKVPNWRFPARFPIDFVRRTFPVDSDKLTAENSNEISIHFLKTGLSARIVRGGRLAERARRLAGYVFLVVLPHGSVP